MELEKIAKKIEEEFVLDTMKEEFENFKASVIGELSGFRIAIVTSHINPPFYSMSIRNPQ